MRCTTATNGRRKTRQRAVDAGIDPLTINRIFPAINLILGSQELNRANIIAKARTAKDGQIAEIMTEALAFVLDQNDGQYRIGQAFKDAVIPGIGWLYCGFNNDPRQERIKLDFRDWKEVFWDPFASPWLESDKCRYAFFQRWMDLFDLQCLYPEREKEIGEAFSGLSAHDSDYSYMDDEADIVEQDKRVLGSTRWSDPERRRIRPVQLWYPVLEKAVFALFPDGQCVEVNTKLPDAQVYMLVRNAQQLITTSVRKLRVKTFIGSYELSDEPSPFPHGQYPFIPFIGYLDRYLNPFGVPGCFPAERGNQQAPFHEPRHAPETAHHRGGGAAVTFRTSMRKPTTRRVHGVETRRPFQNGDH